MEIETEDLLIRKCLQKIEDRLGWGSSELWSTQDYESLSQKIQQDTGVYLSVATLKRIWGKIKYESRPTVTTLDTLAKFGGFENWRALRQQYTQVNGNGSNNGKNHSSPEVKIQIPETKKSNAWRTSLVLGSLALAIALIFTLARSRSKLDADKFSFSSKKVVDEGVPNSVIFDYDAAAASPEDEVMVQQSWDPRLTTVVSRNDRKHTSIYYYPGFFEAKLVVNKKIMKEHNLLITTNGWLPLIEQAPVPVYYKESDARHDGIFQLPLSAIEKGNVPLQPTPPWVMYANYRNFGDLSSDDVVFETELKNDFSAGSGACQFTEIRLQLEGPAIMIPLSVKGCVSELGFAFKEGKKNDMSAFGCDFSNWVKVKCAIKDGNGEVFVNEKSAVRFSVQEKSSKVMGIAFRFQGTGSINYVKLSKNSGQVVYEDNF